ncbi:MAG: MIP family channel protein [Muribaculaceae bacterium]|nr:MIP family channel protein [Muribaculaceae bacterium]
MKKYLAEMVGTMVLVLLGCGTAVALACGADTASVVGTAVAFGLAVVAMAYTIGGISGCHINPAITLGCLLTKRISGKDALMYMIFQVIGAFIGSAILYAFVNTGSPEIAGTSTGANGLAGVGGSALAGIIVEAVLTCIFVLVVLGTTDAKKGAGNFAGLAIGLSLILIHLVGIHFTGTSVNPARSIAPAVFEGGQALTDLWVFIVGPFIGSVLAALVWCIIGCDCKECKK